MVKFIDGNLLEQPFDVLGHQTNCLGVMGGGIAKQIKDKNPIMYEEYRKLCVNLDKALLGTVYLVKEDNGERQYANIFGEYSFTESVAPFENRHTDYDALKKALVALEDSMITSELYSLGLPDHIGCGLAGGDWEGVVLPMIHEIFDNSKVECTIVKFGGK